MVGHEPCMTMHLTKCGLCSCVQSFAEKPKTAEALKAMEVDTTVLGELSAMAGGCLSEPLSSADYWQQQSSARHKPAMEH